jgi:hypothetical protein
MEVLAMLPRATLASVMTVVAIIGVDFAILKAIRSDGHTSGDIALGAMPMAGAALWALAVGLSGLRRGVRRPFLAGFTAFGTAAVLLYGAANVWLSGLVAAYARFTVEALLWPFGDRQPEWVDLATVSLMLSLPQFLFACLGGWLVTELSAVPAESGHRGDCRVSPSSSTA